MSNNYSNLLIIADDFTGANDTGVQLTKKGANVDVYFDWKNDNYADSSDIIVINTDSRALTKEHAQKRILQLTKINNAKRPIYKKIDSTLRGNIGIEVETLVIQENYDIALIISAFPDMNRTVKNGICYVNGTVLTDTEFASDPKTPIYSSQIKASLSKQTDLLCEEVFLNTIRNHQLQKTIEDEITKGTKLLVIDAETNGDLTLIVKQIANIDHRLLLVGSAGLINFLPTAFEAKPPIYPVTQNDLLLVIAGSMSITTQMQIEHALKSTAIWQAIDISIDDLLPDLTDKNRQSYCLLIKDALAAGKNCIVRTSTNNNERHQIDELCQQYHLTRQQLGEHICDCLGQIVKNISINNLFLTGGDVAIAVAKSLGAIGFHIDGEVAPGVPYGRLIGKTASHYRIFTKAGGFGEPNIFTKSLELIYKGV